ncbi:MAG: winged helix-turn-helix domain-containing protein [Novosphingobium sp.]|nr:winged helix-turn-helix domain-containing protein [Novosphingobium sp.]
MRRFGWLHREPMPHDYDLRRCGWRLLEATGAETVPMLADGARLAAIEGRRLFQPTGLRARVVLVGIACPERRARLLRYGFGEVLDVRVGLAELAVRTERIATQALLLPRWRGIGDLSLDLVARDGFVAQRALALFPREFDLLWRLLEQPGEVLAKDRLLREVWRLQHVPETNSLAVHVSRLRAKLAAAGLPRLVQTSSDGGYRIDPEATLLDRACSMRDNRAVPLLAENAA